MEVGFEVVSFHFAERLRNVSIIGTYDFLDEEQAWPYYESGNETCTVQRPVHG